MTIEIAIFGDRVLEGDMLDDEEEERAEDNG